MRILLLLLLIPTAFAQPRVASCGSGAAAIQRIEAIDILSRVRSLYERRLSGLQGRSRIIDGLVVVQADELNAPFGNAFPLHGSTVRFERSGDAAHTVTVAEGTIDSDFGGAVAADSPQSLPFPMPYFGGTISSVYVTAHNALTVDAPRLTSSLQMGELELATMDQAMIAPMLTTGTLQFGEHPDVFVKRTEDAFRVTWQRIGFWSYTVQATLHADGTIVFTYDAPQPPFASALVLTDGRRRTADVPLGRATDALGDAAGNDIVEASAERSGDTDQIRFRIELAENVVTPATFTISAGQPSLSYRILADGHTFLTVPGWGIVRDHPAGRVTGRVVEIDLLQEHLGVPRLHDTLTVTTDTDTAALPVRIDKPKAAVAQRLGSLKSATRVDGPVLEAFTLPVVSVPQVWRQIREQWRLEESDVDAVAIYQNFSSDILLYASAYASPGNAGVDGIIARSSVGSHLPRTPALMNMNSLEYAANGTERMATQSVMHELGHRWLYDFTIEENGASSRILNPVSAHPAQYVHTPAAFTVAGIENSSVMGGGWFRDNADGTFTTARTRANFGFSWTDLYLMGFAAPEEVQPWFYLSGASPRLGPEYYPLANRTYRGTRVPVGIDQVVGSMGPRHPAYPDTQREIRVLFVLLVDPSREVTVEELVQLRTIRTNLERDFTMATGGRAVVRTELDLR